ncbi:hypothetical protein J7T55_009953 [Diaporthe amygdali]|uniref:uncharacterized protein n=1 Tax=Phomopsis amygdali TaxID=1214568 RepID=UPI0022FF0984|nr:uncharacterized protein J7T55_009953 [Diaporthe amygdali]KAJ0116802.1 hypothetical protein J7T55_009953 [Diaporthe amygdali]
MEKLSHLASLSRRKEAFSEPDVMFGIDVGMCFTKVAYAIHESGEYRVCNFQSWTDLGGAENATDYVPTILYYEKEHGLLDDAPKQIGFMKKHQRGQLRAYEWFKEHFPGNLPYSPEEPGKTQGTSNTHSSSTDTFILYRHLLTKIYVAIKNLASEMLKDGPNWEDACIEFIFSVPATWNRLTETLDNITERFRAVVKEAGFGDQNHHKVMIGLTEPEAAAAFCLSSNDDSHYIQDGHKVLMVDAGGGTTDICLLDKRPSQTGEITIDPLSAPVGEKLGSSRIDRSFERLARDKLRKLAHDNHLTEIWDTTKMSREMRETPDFQNNKKSLDMTKIRNGEYFTVPLSSADLGLTGVPDVLAGDDVMNNQLKFDFLELANIFDEAVLEDREVLIKGRPETLPGMIKLINRHRDQLLHRGDRQGSDSSTATDINLILLSGGLGSSAYIKYKIEEFLSKSPGAGSGVSVPKVHTLTHPQIEGRRYVEQNQPRPSEPPTLLHTFEIGAHNLLVEFVVSNEVKPSRFPSREDFIAKVSCDLAEPARDPEGNLYCYVELCFHVARVEVKCSMSKVALFII